MNVIKKVVVMFLIVIMLIFAILPSFSYADINSAQRKALVDLVVKMVDEGNKARILRYSQKHRMIGFDWRTVSGSSQQVTRATVNVPEVRLYGDVTAAMNKDEGNRPDKWRVAETISYYCFLKGEDIQGTIPFDCSSLASAAYNMAFGTDFGNWAWCSGDFSKSSKYFSVSNESPSKLKPGDILWKQGHVAIYLGDCYGNGGKYIAEAAGFAMVKKNDSELGNMLADFLVKNPKYIIDHKSYNNKMPELDLTKLSKNAVMDATKQVLIREYKPGRFDKVATYIGPVDGSNSRIPDVENLKYNGPASNSEDGEEHYGTGTGLDHGPITLPGNYTTVWPDDLVLEDQVLATSEGYFYKGTPTYGQYIGRIDMFNWLITGIENVLDWLIGFITYALKAVIIGWTALLEDTMSSILNFGITSTETQTASLNEDINVLNKVYSLEAIGYMIAESDVKLAKNSIPVLDLDSALSDEEKEEAEETAGAIKDFWDSAGDTVDKINSNPNVEGNVTEEQLQEAEDRKELLDTEKNKHITIEEVLFNKVPVLDINFFDFKNAGGETLQEGSLIYKVREAISNWYYIIRMAVLMGMLVALLYIAIKIAISVPTKKAEYKSKLIDWFIGFIIVFFIHYFMIGVIYLNNSIVEIFEPIVKNGTTVDVPKVDTGSSTNTNIDLDTTNDGKTSLYEAIRIQSYDVKATTGWTATIMYMVLVVLMIRFVILYAKRMFTIAVLLVVSPIMGLLYSINKKKYKIGDWGREFLFNVLIQVIHVVIYASIISLAFDLAKTSTFKGGFIALVAIGFLFVAEGIVKKIFGFNKASSSGSLLDSTVGQLAVIGAAKSIYEKGLEKGKKVASSGAPNWVVDRYNKNLHKHMQVSNWSNEFKKPSDIIENDEEARLRRANQALNSKAYVPNTTILNGKEYIVDENGVPMARYDEVDPDKKKFFSTGYIDNTIEDKHRQIISSGWSYIGQGVADFIKTGTGSAALMAALPMLVLSPKYGLGLAGYGFYGVTSGMGRRKIKGVKSPEKKRAWTGKRVALLIATGGFSEGLKNMKYNSIDQKMSIEEFYKHLDKLEEARVEMDELAQELVEYELDRKNNSPTYLDGTESPQMIENKKVMDELLRKQDKQAFEKALNLTLEQLSDKDVQKVVQKYIMKKEIPGLTNRDLNILTAQLASAIGKKCSAIQLNENFAEVLKAEIRDRIVEAGNLVVVDSKKANDTTDSFDYREKYARSSSEGEAADNKTAGQKAENKSADKQKVHTKDTNVDNENDARDKGTNQTVEGGHAITREELEEKVNRAMFGMKQEELIDVIASALKRKEAINRDISNPRYQEIMKRVERLRTLDEEYKEMTGESMFKKYTVEEGKIVPKRDYDGDVEYLKLSDLVKEMRDYFVNNINNTAI